MTNEEVVARIKKLLRLSQSANRHEAELAMARAFSLAQQHQIDLDQVDLSDDQRRIIDDRIRMGWRLPLERRLALGIVHAHFNVNVVLSRPDVLFIGTSSDIAMAQYVVDYLVRTVRVLRGQFDAEEVAARRRVTHAKRHHFTAGFFYGIGGNLRRSEETLQIEQPRYALIKVDGKTRRTEHQRQQFNTHLGRPIAAPRASRDALTAGWIAGKHATITTPVCGAAARLELTDGR